MDPVTGPFVTSVNMAPEYYKNQVSYRQKPPFNKVLPYILREGSAEARPANYASSWANYAEGIDSSSIYNSAYSRVVQLLGENAGVGITLTQWRQADAMIRHRGGQLLDFTKALARRSPAGVAAALGISLRDVQAIMRTRYGVSRSLADLWLEFWFGWKPAVTDIYTACEVFDRPLPWGPLRAVREKSLDPIDYPPNFAFSAGVRFSRWVRVSVGIDVRVVNPNVRLLQEFGLQLDRLIGIGHRELE
jgi:hypothetical protein